MCYNVEEILFYTLSNINIYHIVGMLHYGGRSIFCNEEQNAFDEKLHSTCNLYCCGTWHSDAVLIKYKNKVNYIGNNAAFSSFYIILQENHCKMRKSVNKYLSNYPQSYC